MNLSDKKIEQLKSMPLVQTKVFKSKDGRFLVNQTRISSIKPLEYYEKVLEDGGEDFFD